MLNWVWQTERMASVMALEVLGLYTMILVRFPPPDTSGKIMEDDSAPICLMSQILRQLLIFSNFFALQWTKTKISASAARFDFGLPYITTYYVTHPLTTTQATNPTMPSIQSTKATQRRAHDKGAPTTTSSDTVNPHSHLSFASHSLSPTMANPPPIGKLILQVDCFFSPSLLWPLTR